jgi:hypothetical protein
MKPIIHNIGIKLRVIASLFFFTRRVQAKMEQMITAIGYEDIASTKERLYRFTPLSKLINDNPQMTNHGKKDRKNKNWVMIRYSFIYFLPVR